MQAGLSRDRARNRIQLSGDLTSRTVSALFARAPQFGGQPVRVDLSAVGDVDSSGLALLLHWSQLAGASAGQLVFTGAPAQLCKMAKIAGLEGRLNLAGSSGE